MMSALRSVTTPNVAKPRSGSLAVSAFSSGAPHGMHLIRTPLSSRPAPCAPRHGWQQPQHQPWLGGGSLHSAPHSVAARSFLGVGAPEAVLVAVVALVVFGPKGLAEAAKTVGQTLRGLQPTIREVVSVSQDLKGTLEKELGLDELRESTRAPPRPRGLSTTSASLSSSDPEFVGATTTAGLSGSTLGASSAASSFDETEAQLEAKRLASAQQAWGGNAPSSPSSSSTPAPTAPAGSAKPAAPASLPAVADMSIDQLEAELARRRAASQPPPRPPPQA